MWTFDGVIHSYASGWRGDDVVADPPVPGAIAWLRNALEHWDVQVYSSRSKSPAGIAAMISWLETFAAHEWGDIEKAKQFVTALKFPVLKPSAFLMIDNRAICFDGKWADLDPEKLLSFKPWNKK